MAGVNVTRLARTLAARDLTEEQLARLTGYSPATVAAYLSGRKRATDAFALAAEVVLKLKPEALGRTT